MLDNESILSGIFELLNDAKDIMKSIKAKFIIYKPKFSLGCLNLVRMILCEETVKVVKVMQY
ncbi:unnamed protein product [marine sediment metagenome]|uniref:Uncharacterized protein n=1 Tax=marine sediment metagenome TaxID=412755 RepID=X1TPS9_9ZZZZ